MSQFVHQSTGYFHPTNIQLSRESGVKSWEYFTNGRRLTTDSRHLTNPYLRRRMIKKKEIVMSGIRPTGFLHLGNYFGALKNYVSMQEEYECFFMVADLH